MNICVKYYHIYTHRYATHQLHTNEQRCNIRGVSWTIYSSIFTRSSCLTTTTKIFECLGYCTISTGPGWKDLSQAWFIMIAVTTIRELLLILAKKPKKSTSKVPFKCAMHVTMTDWIRIGMCITSPAIINYYANVIGHDKVEI